ncbi:MAG: anaerobic ribonucleoside-triphosphate reductase activating protein [Hydrogenothermaceae bacterium]
MIYDLTPFTLLDFPKKIAAIIWFGGCNMRCLYCYNPDIVFAKSGKLTEENILSFLKERRSLLDGIVYCGGEPTNYRGIFDLSKKIKELGFLVKLDTNGTSPETIKGLIESKLIDYVALDIKAPGKKYEDITGYKDFQKIENSLKILINSDIDFEVRTTIHSDLISERDLMEIIGFLEKNKFTKIYYIQNYIHTKTIGNIKKPEKNVDLQKLTENFIKNISFKIEFRNF